MHLRTLEYFEKEEITNLEYKTSFESDLNTQLTRISYLGSEKDSLIEKWMIFEYMMFTLI